MVAGECQVDDGRVDAWLVGASLAHPSDCSWQLRGYRRQPPPPFPPVPTASTRLRASKSSSQCSVMLRTSSPRPSPPSTPRTCPPPQPSTAARSPLATTTKPDADLPNSRPQLTLVLTRFYPRRFFSPARIYDFSLSSPSDIHCPRFSYLSHPRLTPSTSLSDDTPSHHLESSALPHHLASFSPCTSDLCLRSSISFEFFFGLDIGDPLGLEVNIQLKAEESSDQIKSNFKMPFGMNNPLPSSMRSEFICHPPSLEMLTPSRRVQKSWQDPRFLRRSQTKLWSRQSHSPFNSSQCKSMACPRPQSLFPSDKSL